MRGLLIWTYDRRRATYATDMRHDDMRKSKSRDVVRVSRTSKVVSPPKPRRHLDGAKLQFPPMPDFLICDAMGNLLHYSALEDKTMSIMIDLPPAMAQEAREYAAVRGTTLERMVVDYLKMQLSREREADDVYGYLMRQSGWLPDDYVFNREEAVVK